MIVPGDDDDDDDDDDMGPLPDDEGDRRGHTDASLRKLRLRVDLHKRLLDPTEHGQVPLGHKYGPHFDDSMA